MTKKDYNFSDNINNSLQLAKIKNQQITKLFDRYLRRITQFGLSTLHHNTTFATDFNYLNNLFNETTDSALENETLHPTQFVDECESNNEKSFCRNFPSTFSLSSITDKNSSNADNCYYDKNIKIKILKSLDVLEYLILRFKDPYSTTFEVRGGSKIALIVYATQNCSLLYQEAFLVTYRSFVTTKELMQRLIQRYYYTSAEKGAQYQKAARQTFSVLVRVINDLCTVEITKELITIITLFIHNLFNSGNYEFAKILRKRFIEIVEKKTFLFHENEVPTCTKNQRVPSIFEFRSSALAKQITYLDAELLKKIEPAEMLWWAEEQNEEKSPNVVLFTEHFNRISYWVRTQVITQPNQRERERYIIKFIKIMKQLKKLGNYSSYLAILSALDSGPLRRLHWSQSIKDQLAEHAEIMESSHSFKNYRTLLAETEPPCLPYIGLILQDLTFIHVGNSDYLFEEQDTKKTKNFYDKTYIDKDEGNPQNIINFSKKWQQFAILDNIRRFKNWPYDIQRNNKVLSAFNNFSSYLQEEETWERSFELKPKSKRQQQKSFV